AIEKDMARLRELREALPHVETAVKQRQQVQQAETKAAALGKERQEIEAKVAERGQTGDQGKQKRKLLGDKIAADDTPRPSVGAELTKLARVLERVKQYERQKQILGKQEEELARLPADTHEAVEAAQRRCDELAAVERALPPLERLSAQREGMK